MKQNVVRLKNLNIPVRYFKLHNKKLRRLSVVDKSYIPQIEIFVYYSATMFAATYLKLIIKGNKYSVQFVEGMWVSYHLPDKLKKLDAWLNLMGYTYESLIQRI